MRAKLLLIILFLTLFGFRALYSNDTLSYSYFRFNKNFIFIDNFPTNRNITNNNPITHARKEINELKSVTSSFRNLSFEGVTFDSLADFKMVKFKHNVQFYNSVFSGKSTFAYSVFEGSTSFWGSIFNDPNIDFSSTTYDLDIGGGSSFLESHFKKAVDFNGVYFKNEAFFVLTKFDDTVSFWQTDFRKVAHFNSAIFSNIAFFSMVKFEDGADFGGAILPDTLYFYDVTEIGKEIDLTSGILPPKNKVCYINLTGSNIEKIRINYDQFKLFFLPSKTTNNEITAVYEKLLKKFHDDGFADSYKKLDIEFQKYNYNKSGQWFRSWLQEWWWNYGYNKEKIFQNSFTLLLIFFIINVLIGVKWGYNFLIKEVYEVENIELEVERLEAKYASQKIKLFFSWLPMVFIYTCMLFFILNLNIKHIRYRHKYALTYLLSVFMIGLVCAAYIINFVLDK